MILKAQPVKSFNLADTPEEFVRGVVAELNGQAAVPATREASLSHETSPAKRKSPIACSAYLRLENIHLTDN